MPASVPRASHITRRAFEVNGIVLRTTDTPTHFEAQSHADPAHWYAIVVAENQPEHHCTCEPAQATTQPCKHVLAMREMLSQPDRRRTPGDPSGVLYGRRKTNTPKLRKSQCHTLCHAPKEHSGLARWHLKVIYWIHTYPAHPPPP